MTPTTKKAPRAGGFLQKTNSVTISEVSLPVKRTQWGPVRLNKENACLEIDTGHSGYWYEVDLARCCSSAQVLDWLCQIKNKTWATDEIIAALVRAIDDTLQPQANLCGSGIDKRLSPSEIRRAVVRHGR